MRTLCVLISAQPNDYHAGVQLKSLNVSKAYEQGKTSIRNEGMQLADGSSGIIVTEDNFPQAYSNLRFDAIIKQAGGINKFLEMPTASSDPSKQFVVRMNRDTYYCLLYTSDAADE